MRRECDLGYGIRVYITETGAAARDQGTDHSLGRAGYRKHAQPAYPRFHPGPNRILPDNCRKVANIISHEVCRSLR
jgi:hypothetical protein